MLSFGQEYTADTNNMIDFVSQPKSKTDTLPSTYHLIRQNSDLNDFVFSFTSANHYIPKNTFINLPNQCVILDNSICFLQTEMDGVHPFIIGNKIGESNNKIKKSIDLKSNEKVALKFIDTMFESDIHKSCVEREIKRETCALTFYKRLKGMGCFEKSGKDRSKRYLCFAQNLVPGGDLDKYIREIKNANEKEQDPHKLQMVIDDLFQIAYLFCCEVVKCHADGFFHRDIKPANIVVAKNPNGYSLTLIDFGGMVKISEIGFDIDGNYGTPGYRAPELKQGGNHNEATEAYATGKSIAELFDIITRDRFPLAVIKGGDYYKSLRSSFKEIIDGLTQLLPQNRISLIQAISKFEAQISQKNGNIKGFQF